METSIEFKKPSIFSKISNYFKGKTVAFHLINLFLIIWVLSLTLVLIWGISISLMDGLEYSLNPKRIIPYELKFENYIDAVNSIGYKIGTKKVTFLGMLINNIWYAFGVMFLRVVATTLASYCVAKVKFKGRLVIYYIVLFQMLLPTYGSDVSYNLILRQIGLYDTPLYLLANFAGHGTWFLLMYSTFRGVSDSYAEAARIDGAKEFVIFGRVMLPFAKGIITAMVILLLMSTWNDYQTPLLYLPSYPNLSTGLFRYKTLAAHTLDMAKYFAGLLISSIPVVIIYIVFNKTLMENMSLGGLKG